MTPKQRFLNVFPKAKCFQGYKLPSADRDAAGINYSDELVIVLGATATNKNTHRDVSIYAAHTRNPADAWRDAAYAFGVSP